MRRKIFGMVIIISMFVFVPLSHAETAPKESDTLIQMQWHITTLRGRLSQQGKIYKQTLRSMEQQHQEDIEMFNKQLMILESTNKRSTQIVMCLSILCIVMGALGYLCGRCYRRE